jgi:hypothetical protein
MTTVRGEYNPSSSIGVTEAKQLFVILVPCPANVLDSDLDWMCNTTYGCVYFMVILFGAEASGSRALTLRLSSPSGFLTLELNIMPNLL